MFENGYIERLIKQIGSIVTRVSLGAHVTEEQVSPETIDSAWGELLGIPAGLLDVIDATTLAQLLRTPAKQRLGADLLEADADARDADGREGGEHRRRLARELRRLLE